MEEFFLHLKPLGFKKVVSKCTADYLLLRGKATRYETDDVVNIRITNGWISLFLSSKSSIIHHIHNYEYANIQDALMTISKLHVFKSYYRESDAFRIKIIASDFTTENTSLAPRPLKSVCNDLKLPLL